MKDAECSTGIEYLDRLLGGLRIGDNVVWETDAGAHVDLFVEKFERHSLAAGHNLVYVSFNRSPMTMVRKLSELPNQENITLLDCFTSGKGDNDATFTRFYESGNHRREINVIRVDDPVDVSQFTRTLNEVEEEKGEGARYVFDSVTGMQDLWDDEAKAYKFFTYSCPRLYDLNTVAYWILEKEAHTSSFKANLEHVTQVAIEVSHANGPIFLKLTKSEDRRSPNMFKPQKFEVWDDEIVFREAAEKEVLDLGGKVKALRLKRGLTQSELGKKISVTASYISQLERNLVSPSIESLMLLSAELQIDPGYFVSLNRPDAHRIICRKSQRQPVGLAVVKEDSVKCQLLADSTDNRRMQPMLVTIEPDSEFPGHLFSHKGDEFILILRGELELDIENRSHVLREGDSIYLDSMTPTAWRNTAEMPVQAVWVLSPPSI
jgi:transcriptional regulator with XRE-family HTH domain/KaiC/GvpD/RAD55 family RecA-like ATPase